MPFASLGLSNEIVRSLTERKYTTPTPIQSQAIPAILSGCDLLAGAQTGTGKTAGFTLPILQRLSNRITKGPSEGRPPIRALILTPTRELAAQVDENVRAYGKYLKLNSFAVYGGVSMHTQLRQLRNRIDILVATPGRLLDHVQQRTIDLSQVEILVLDEADRMLDMGFMPDITRILNLMPAQRQNLLFSATSSPEIASLAQKLLKQPQVIQIARQNATAENISQIVYRVDADKKRDLLTHLIREKNWFQVLVFTRTKHGADRLSDHLSRAGIRSDAIHGDKRQSQRSRTLAQFQQNRLQVLVATDVAARGLNINDLPQVVNYEMPTVAGDYIHRIGRTGRAGNNGEAISLVSNDEYSMLTSIERLTKHTFTKEMIAGFEPTARGIPSATPARSNRNTGARRGATATNSRFGRSAPRFENSRSDRFAAPRSESSSRPSGEGRARTSSGSRNSHNPHFSQERLGGNFAAHTTQMDERPRFQKSTRPSTSYADGTPHSHVRSSEPRGEPNGNRAEHASFSQSPRGSTSRGSASTSSYGNLNYAERKARDNAAPYAAKSYSRSDKPASARSRNPQTASQPNLTRDYAAVAFNERKKQAEPRTRSAGTQDSRAPRSTLSVPPGRRSGTGNSTGVGSGRNSPRRGSGRFQ